MKKVKSIIQLMCVFISMILVLIAKLGGGEAELIIDYELTSLSYDLYKYGIKNES